MRFQTAFQANNLRNTAHQQDVYTMNLRTIIMILVSIDLGHTPIRRMFELQDINNVTLGQNASWTAHLFTINDFETEDGPLILQARAGIAPFDLCRRHYRRVAFDRHAAAIRFPSCMTTVITSRHTDLRPLRPTAAFQKG